MSEKSFSYYCLYALLGIDLILIGLHCWHVTQGILADRYALHSYQHPFYSILAAFNADGEGTVVAWFSSAKFLIAGVISLLLARSLSSKKMLQPTWLLIGLLFIALSADETASLHETVAGALMQLTTVHSGFEWFVAGDGYKNSFAWVIIFAPLALVLMGFLTYTFYAYLREFRPALLGCTAGLLFFALAMLCEASVFFAPDVADWHSTGFIYIYKLGTALEELFELFGTSFLVFGLTYFLMHKLEFNYSVRGS